MGKYWNRITPFIYLLLGAILVIRAAFWVWSSELLPLPMKVALTVVKVVLIIVILRYLWNRDRDTER